MTIKKVGLNKVEGKVTKKSDVEFAKEFTKGTANEYIQKEGKTSSVSERVNFDVYPGE